MINDILYEIVSYLDMTTTEDNKILDLFDPDTRDECLNRWYKSNKKYKCASCKIKNAKYFLTLSADVKCGFCCRVKRRKGNKLSSCDLNNCTYTSCYEVKDTPENGVIMVQLLYEKDLCSYCNRYCCNDHYYIGTYVN